MQNDSYHRTQAHEDRYHRGIAATGNVAARREIPISSEVGGLAVTEVRIGSGAVDNVEVVRGLDAGDRIVTQGAGFLNDGDVVNVKTATVRNGAVR
ncbi:hypothetical protein [Bradyrhizobium neotropicale]|uniref:hypothetical protein n=1 Tax=Bradyrhizobium neotropicale TaxID=1497615 RepID=UPI001FEFF916|nr:hypothetical protein [Bradyrhizobium neotropicale]